MDKFKMVVLISCMLLICGYPTLAQEEIILSEETALSDDPTRAQSLTATLSPTTTVQTLDQPHAVVAFRSTTSPPPLYGGLIAPTNLIGLSYVSRSGNAQTVFMPTASSDEVIDLDLAVSPSYIQLVSIVKVLPPGSSSHVYELKRYLKSKTDPNSLPVITTIPLTLPGSSLLHTFHSDIATTPTDIAYVVVSFIGQAANSINIYLVAITPTGTFSFVPVLQHPIPTTNTLLSLWPTSDIHINLGNNNTAYIGVILPEYVYPYTFYELRFDLTTNSLTTQTVINMPHPTSPYLLPCGEYLTGWEAEPKLIKDIDISTGIDLGTISCVSAPVISAYFPGHFYTTHYQTYFGPFASSIAPYTTRAADISLVDASTPIKPLLRASSVDGGFIFSLGTNLKLGLSTGGGFTWTDSLIYTTIIPGQISNPRIKLPSLSTKPSSSNFAIAFVQIPTNLTLPETLKIIFSPPSTSTPPIIIPTLNAQGQGMLSIRDVKIEMLP